MASPQKHYNKALKFAEKCFKRLRKTTNEPDHHQGINKAESRLNDIFREIGVDKDLTTSPDALPMTPQGGPVGGDPSKEPSAPQARSGSEQARANKPAKTKQT